MVDPTAIPIIQVSLDGHLLPDRDTTGLTGLRLQQRLSQPSLCELYFRDPPGPLDFLAEAYAGQELRVSLPGYSQDLFQGDLTALEYHHMAGNQREVYLRAYDRLHRLRKRQTVSSFEDINLAKLTKTLCRNLGLDALKVIHSDLAWPLIIQHGQTDFDLLVEMATLEGLYLTTRGNDLHLITLAGMAGDPIQLTLDENLHEAHLEVNADSACDRVIAWGWNTSPVELTHGEAKAPRTGRHIRTKVSVTTAGGLPERSLVNQAAPSHKHAAALAQAELDRRVASEVTFRGLTQGNPALQPGSIIEVDGVAPNVAGCYVLTQVTHLIDASGYRTEVGTDPPQVASSPQADIATFGEVFNVSDPSGLARVRVRLPVYNDVQSHWMSVVIPGAGADKGLIALPDVGDTVLVLLPGGNPGLGFVLGGLYAQHKPPDSGVDLGRVRTYTWITPSNQKIQLHDDLTGGKIRLESGSGSYIELNGGRITISGHAIDFEKR